jgi:hypothetical protein
LIAKVIGNTSSFILILITNINPQIRSHNNNTEVMAKKGLKRLQGSEGRAGDIGRDLI